MSVVSSIRLCFPFVVITEQRLTLQLPSRCISRVLMYSRSQLPVRHVSSLLTPPLTCFSVSLHPNCHGAFTQAADFISELSILGSLCAWSFLLLCCQCLTLEVENIKQMAFSLPAQLSSLSFTVHYCINSACVPVDPLNSFLCFVKVYCSDSHSQYRSRSAFLLELAQTRQMTFFCICDAAIAKKKEMKNNSVLQNKLS